MAKHTVLALLSAVVLAGEGAAQPPERDEVAAATCKILDRIVAAAGTDFEAYRGKQVTPNSYEGTIAVSAFRNCSVWLSAGAMYACMRPAQSEAETQSLYDDAVSKARECFAGWDEVPLFEAEAPGLTAVKTFRLAKSFDAGVVSFGVVHARDTRAGAPADLVMIVTAREPGSPLGF